MYHDGDPGKSLDFFTQLWSDDVTLKPTGQTGAVREHSHIPLLQHTQRGGGWRQMSNWTEPERDCRGANVILKDYYGVLFFIFSVQLKIKTCKAN